MSSDEGRRPARDVLRSQASVPNPDPKSIRALAHPLRLRILDLLSEHKQLTATEVSDMVGESPTNCAFHLRTLARYGFVEDAGGGRGRERPWRTKPGWMRLETLDADPETVSAISAAQVARREQERRRRQAWEEREATAPRAWREAAFSQRYDTPLTPSEMRRVSDAVAAAVMDIIDNRSDEVKEKGTLVQISCSAFPFGANLEESAAEDAS